MNLAHSNNDNIEKLKELAHFFARCIKNISVEDDRFKDYCLDFYLPVSLEHYESWMEDQSNIKQLKLAVSCFGFTAFNALSIHRDAESVDAVHVELLRGLKQYNDIRNEIGYFLLHPEHGYGQVIDDGGDLKFQRANQTESISLDDCYDPPFSLFKFEFEGKTIFEVPGPTCPIQDAFLEHALTDNGSDNPIVKLRKLAGATPRHQADIGYTSLSFDNPEGINAFLFALEDYFQVWCIRMSDLGVLKKICDLNDECAAGPGVNYAYLGINERKVDPEVSSNRRTVPSEGMSI